MWTHCISHLPPTFDLYLRIQKGGGAVLHFSPRGLDTPVTLPPPPHYRFERAHKSISGILGMEQTKRDHHAVSKKGQTHVQ